METRKNRVIIRTEPIIIICEQSDTPVILPDLHDCASRANIVNVHAEDMET